MFQRKDYFCEYACLQGTILLDFLKQRSQIFPYFFAYFTSAYEFLQMVLLAALLYLFSSSSIVLLENCVVSLF